MSDDFRQIFGQFKVRDKFGTIEPLSMGHINDSFIINAESGKSYFLQKINTNVFAEPEKLRYNYMKMQSNLPASYKGHDQYTFPEIYRTINDSAILEDNKKQNWKLTDFVRDTITIDFIRTEDEAFEAAKAYGFFDKQLAKLNTSAFYKTLHGYHTLNLRVRALKASIKRDVKKRRNIAGEEINNIINLQYITDAFNQILKNKEFVTRITHSDAKPSNILFDKKTMKARAVIDLDTVMPDSLIFDFGDMVRSFTSPEPEDSTNLNGVLLREEIFKALTQGFLAEVSSFVTEKELKHFLLGAKVIIYMQAIRFLTDFLNGDTYYKTKYDDHNLDRTRNQLKLLESLIDKEVKLEKSIIKF